MLQSLHFIPSSSLYYPLSHDTHSIAPGVLDIPIRQSTQKTFGGVFPLVPAGHALNPDSDEPSILDPCGTTIEAEPPVATICPALTGSHDNFCGFD